MRFAEFTPLQNGLVRDKIRGKFTANNMDWASLQQLYGRCVPGRQILAIQGIFSPSSQANGANRLQPDIAKKPPRYVLGHDSVRCRIRRSFVIGAN